MARCRSDRPALFEQGALLHTVESVAMVLHSSLASLELLIFNSLYSILEVKYYYDVAGAPLVQKFYFVI